MIAILHIFAILMIVGSVLCGHLFFRVSRDPTLKEVDKGEYLSDLTPSQAAARPVLAVILGVACYSVAIMLSLAEMLLALAN